MPWPTVRADGIQLAPPGNPRGPEKKRTRRPLRDVNGLLAGLDHLEQATVRDPFGREYRPVRHQTHRYLAPGAGSIYYVEIKPRVRELRHTGVQH
ncbi:hypothetical protein OOZ51_17470 [Arthrobacter sp. MI7-26]|uniref:hypothetical protein n=1 Tax=Arthrobacter sp. MI7-26 TaxID=2993653 RepID=UPI002248EC7E|nr:hypothetical protein [Arthrobacter sp. MI7-26]MCX2749587.1 hypothetical protein [Arthrobacter sp. MI7-26]